ncbi:alpha-L-fucosidase [uncultured Polaribacter sp.]|uniref:alpha-L-fucosidase n=1 Tax=uncultured Polaribacter sp. TaxID=174711 RepID=UPI0026343DDA|nr:alpha-L-fucosidase [uncultured Polaribacter sp.]
MKFIKIITIVILLFSCNNIKDIKVSEKQAYDPTWVSLENYNCPKWFSDGKLGIWSHWGPTSVTEFGDWYQRHLYIESPETMEGFSLLDWEAARGKIVYDFHNKTYGHPSFVGAKDICNLWKANKFEPEKLMKLFKRVGAKYFVALANHHDNFDLWDSKYQPWNSMNIGPKKDIVGLWEKAARKEGLHFGVTVHAARSWYWMQPAHQSDAHGPLKGVLYDGVLREKDGKGTWWEGYDPQDLYCKPIKPRQRIPDQEYIDKFVLRTKDLIDSYHPDLLYFDDGQYPNVSKDIKVNAPIGLNMYAYHYNQHAKWSGEKDQAVLNIKRPKSKKAIVYDVERGASGKKMKYPWQTDTCIGDWFYKKNVNYKSVDKIVDMFVDIVSKNGNLLLSVPQPNNGVLDNQEIAILEGIAEWMDINSEGIYATKPWAVFGEGYVATQGGRATERKETINYTGADFRFTQKEGVVYAFAMDWPDKEQAVIQAMSKDSPLVNGKISKITLLGYGNLSFNRDKNSLKINLPNRVVGKYAFCFKIEGLTTIFENGKDTLLKKE